MWAFYHWYLSGHKHFQCLLKPFSNVEKKAEEETDERFWDAMLEADRKDYERICTEFGVADLHLILKKLEEKKKKRVQNKCKVWRLSAFKEDALPSAMLSIQFLSYVKFVISQKT